ncbi:MAG: hypothetical protein ABIR24_14465 [Verrucomicrobiota bacterium]
MNDSEQFDTAPDFGSGSKEAREQYEGLRKLLLATLVAVLILSGSLNIFLLRQMAFIRKDLESARPKVSQLLASYQKNEEPEIKRFVNTLVGFARTHPDFNPILAKYKIVPETPTAIAPTGVPTKPASK